MEQVHGKRSGMKVSRRRVTRRDSESQARASRQDPGNCGRAQTRFDNGLVWTYAAAQRSSSPRPKLPPHLTLLFLVAMDGWSKLQSGLAGLNIGQSANKFAKGFQSSVQATKERLGQVAPEEITELPQGKL